jgi:hypothetical protein
MAGAVFVLAFYLMYLQKQMGCCAKTSVPYNKLILL